MRQLRSEGKITDQFAQIMDAIRDINKTFYNLELKVTHVDNKVAMIRDRYRSNVPYSALFLKSFSLIIDADTFLSNYPVKDRRQILIGHIDKPEAETLDFAEAVLSNDFK